MKICCERCGRWFDTEEHEGLCPNCGTWNSLSASSEQALLQKQTDAPRVGGLPDKDGVQPAKEQYGEAAQQREERVPRWPFVVMGLIAALIGIAILIVPAGIERRRSEEAAVYNRVEDPLITAAQQPDAATAAPYTYRLVGVEWVDYDGEWMLPRGCGLLRVELAVSAAKRVDWAPEPPYLGLPDGSWQRALSEYDGERVVEPESGFVERFPDAVYYFYPLGQEANYSFYYLAPREGGAMTLCFERYSVSGYGNRLEEIVELPFTVPGEEADG